MKALLIADLHGSQQFLISLSKIVKYYDIILCCGDLTDFGRPEGFAERFDEIFEGKTCFWVSGNNDIGQDYQYRLKNMQNIDGKIIEYQGFKLAGLGGSHQNYESQNFGPSLLNKNLDLSGTILLTHVPPSLKLQYSPVDIICATNNETTVSLVAPKERSGMKKLNNVPLAHICGHLHTPAGVACIGSTKVIKLAPAKLGNYAEMDLDKLKVELKETR